jgi:hypothetical protein
MSAPLAVDLYCGLGGWTEGLLAEGYDVEGYDIEAHEYGDEKYPARLVLEDVMSLHGSKFKDAALIVASPPCQEFSYMAMPWGRAKQIARALRGEDEFPEGYTGSRTIGELTALFDACFRIQREASEAAGLHIPLVVENVRGAEPWVGRAAWNFGSYYLWGDVPALMPATIKARKNPGFRFDGSGKSFQSESVNQHVKVPSVSGRSPAPGNGARFTSRDCGVEAAGLKHRGDWFSDPSSPSSPSSPSRQGGQSRKKLAVDEGRKGAGAGAAWFDQNLCVSSSKSPARKAASAKIAKIPFALSSWIARTYKPKQKADAA